MKSNKSSSILKEMSRGQLLGHYGTFISAILIVELSSFGILYFTDSVTDSNTLTGNILYYAISFLVQLISGIFAFGSAKMYLSLCSDRSYSLNDLFHGFRTHPDKIIKIQLYIFGIVLCHLLPGALIYLIYYVTSALILIPFIALVTTVGFVLMCIRLLELSQCFYIMLDFPDLSLKQVIAMSKKVMTGYRGKLFYIYVSYIPLLLLGIISFGFGMLWVLPYIYAVNANFYLDLMQIYEDQYRTA